MKFEPVLVDIDGLRARLDQEVRRLLHLAGVPDAIAPDITTGRASGIHLSKSFLNEFIVKEQHEGPH